ncbi:Predicted AAA-ATPase [uncultured Roseburia sp.]|uniref:ATP-binding protein n=1 Tax=Brotonthovivens ammoniilytica TaxID=2981725 RepID=A0ABT2THV1_9FIRM|nr:AAA family ATPase [Brotonthovivens ammoniilytica]MCU6761144.1 ATP-binding protein [Brotonthovivens ammoniilytica]SCI20202.1 Predicted AAA-ATPase [uncultured Roseburia sp.]
MEKRRKKLPIGIENFEKLRTEDFYYVDKTKMIKELLDNWAEVNLFTRPRRFGKSLNMSMLKNFFSFESDKELFEGLEIFKETALCEAYMGKFPVISISLKGINAGNYETARGMAIRVINEEADRLQYLLKSDRLTDNDKARFCELLKRDMDDVALFSSLKELSRLLQKHYNSQVIVLIDEYDVPLAKAFDQGYYNQMVILLRNLFEQVLKTNDSLKFAVMTGCMRITKESIFTGLNNLRILSVADVEFNEYFGFTDKEVKELLEYYDISRHYQTMKNWYDGYQFGKVEVYCPWDVICHCSKLCVDDDVQPQNYWSNTSDNEVVKKFIQGADIGTTKNEIERLVAGEVIKKEIHQEMTYKDMYNSIDNIWSVLFMTGYLTQRGKQERKSLNLAIPNMEIREVFTEQIIAFFKETIQKNGESVNALCDALREGRAEEAEKIFAEYLRKTISIRDTFARKQLKENFYHGILLGLLGYQETWVVSFNKESGDGYSDILVEIGEEEKGIIIELKYAEDGNLEAGCRAALEQIEKNRYEEVLYEDGIDHVLKYGIACYKKRCKIILA